MNLSSIIEGILYYKGQPVSIKDLVKLTAQKESAVREALDELRNNLKGHGLSLVVNESKAELCTHADLADMMAKLQKEELEKPLSKPSIETLAIIAYSNGVARSEIEYIRGVNSTFILRSLEVRGLIEKKSNPNDKRTMLYYPTIDFLKTLGKEQSSDLPDYESFQEKISRLQENSQNEEEL
jgi:segregation and condensation protein B